MVGSGAWACAAVRILGQNCLAADEADEFVDDVRMWVYEEDYQVRGGGPGQVPQPLGDAGSVHMVHPGACCLGVKCTCCGAV